MKLYHHCGTALVVVQQKYSVAIEEFALAGNNLVPEVYDIHATGRSKLECTCPDCGVPVPEKDAFMECYRCGSQTRLTDFCEIPGESSVLLCPKCRTSILSHAGEAKIIPVTIKLKG